jgi:hypothetical protein
MQGLLPADEMGGNELDRQLLDGRYCEIRMLYYLGKDLIRWLDQCMEVISRDAELVDNGVRRASLAQLLVACSPPRIAEKLSHWGVADYSSIFRRAIGLHAVFTDLPSRGLLADDFVRQHHYYADALFVALLENGVYARIRPEDFQFELYASGEYTKMLEAEWDPQ